MTPEPSQAEGAEALRGALRHGLTTAMKARDADALAALRMAIAAIDNAEAVAAPSRRASVTSTHIAGARSGAGSTEAPRQQLGSDDLRDILRGQIAEHAREADRYDTLGQADAAERLRRQARTIEAYLRVSGARAARV